MCGIPGDSTHQWDYGTCGSPKACVQPIPGTDRTQLVDAFATLVKQGGTWVLRDVWCPAASVPAPDPQALREQAVRLLPTVDIGAAWQHTALVNTQTILWADTAAQRPLPTVSVLGQSVQLRISIDQAHWDFGDGISATTTDPGRPYDPVGDPCDTAQCPDYGGHTYASTGSMTITLQVSWHAQFSLDGRTWTDIDPAGLTGPASTRTLTVEQARSVLVGP